MTVKEFERYFKELYLPLGMYALRIVDDVDDAEDIVEESFIKTWNLIEDGTVINNFKAFMYRTVRNQCISYLRTKQSCQSIDEVLEIDEEEIDTSERDARIWKAIDNLPARCREVFLLSKRDGLSNDEISEELGLSVKTVKNQLTKALSRLRESLSGQYKPFFLPFL